MSLGRNSAIIFVILMFSAIDHGCNSSLNRKQNSTKERVVPRIVGGEICNPKDHPYLVRIFYYQHVHICAGSLLNSKWVLTAAHCIGSALFVAAAVASNEEVYVRVRKGFIHPRFDSVSLENDIGMLSLMQTIPESHYIKFVKLPVGSSNQNMTSSCRDVVAMGWGALSERARHAEKQLRCVTLPIINLETCHALLEGKYSFHYRNVICTHSKNQKDACQGDSGGPVMCNNVQVGIVSWGIGCADPKYPGIHSRVDSYLEFIRTTIKNDAANVQCTTVAVFCSLFSLYVLYYLFSVDAT